MIFKKEETTRAYTVFECSLCGKESRQELVPGDCLFAESYKCSCGGMAIISMIYGEKEEKRVIRLR